MKPSQALHAHREAIRDMTARHRVTEFRGMDTASWAGTDAREYVHSERDAWEG